MTTKKKATTHSAVTPAARPIKVAVTTACCFPDETQIWRLRCSAKRFDIALRPYGTRANQQPRGWVDIKIDQALPLFEEFQKEGFTHVLYTDGRDSFFLTGMDEIIQKYTDLGKPSYLIATEGACFPYAQYSSSFPDPGHKFRYPCAGGYFGEVGWLIDNLSMLKRVYAPHYQDNDQALILVAYAEGKLPDMALDTGCQIFQSMSMSQVGVDINIQGSRLKNRLTGSQPAIVHFNGGFVDPEYGRDEAMEPVWDAIGGWPCEKPWLNEEERS